ncbi:PD-(D/E)XK motif protein [Desulfoluna sp.]|uniref:PD-(D/E)XK motif protein n=1 Tax=Desulfoluna sp. TaxID=2045199 RepID=UPI002618F8CC|nr:PD-(D/E)XK motif protein [Desulfoluna sp.]
MTSTDYSPWSGIDCPVTGFKMVRIDSAQPHDFFWGKNTAGDFLLMLEIDKDLTCFLEDKTVELRGVKSDLTYHSATSEYFFILCLQNKEDADIFYRLCMDLVDRTRDLSQLKVALEIIHRRLKRWKTFLSGKKKPLLSAQEVRGLFAELEFLNEGLKVATSQLTFLEGWLGPLDGPHDFVLGDYAVEIKSVSGSQKDNVRISSENQLATHLKRLFLKVFFLAEFQDCKKGESLNQIVDRVRTKLLDSDLIDIFETRLYSSGYIDLKDYDSPCFMVSQKKAFEVRDDFPRITPDCLQDGLVNVSYDLNLNSLKKYVCEVPIMEG